MLTPGDIEQRKDARRKLRAAQRKADVEGLMASGPFRRWLYSVIQYDCGLASEPVTYGGLDSQHRTDMLLGRQSIGRDILAEARLVAPALARQMLVEGLEAEDAEAEQQASDAVPRATETSRK